MVLGSVDKLVDKAKDILYRNLRKFRGYRVVIPHLKVYPIPYCWDTAFHVLALTYINPPLARENVEALLSLQKSDGMIPNAPTIISDQDRRSQPPVIIYAAKHYLDVTGDLGSLREWYPRLKRFYEWWNTCGDTINSIKGLVSPLTGLRLFSRIFRSYTAFWAVCSTGMDNHPVYDFTDGKTVRVGNYHYLRVEDLLLNNILAVSAKALSEIAVKLGLKNDAEYFLRQFRIKASLINRYMWSEEDQFYYPVDWDGRMIKVKSVQAFITLFSEVASEVNASQLIKHLTSPKEFWGRYGIPTVAFDDEKYMSRQPPWMHCPDPFYWRGPIWAPTTYFIFKGLMNYNYLEIAEKLAVKWMELMKKTQTFAEYYYENGEPGMLKRRNFGWTAAVTILLAVESRLINRFKLISL